MNAQILNTFIIVGLLLSTTDRLFAQTETRDMVIERRELMFFMLDSYWPLLDVKRDKSKDLVKAGEAAQAISDAMVKSLGLFPAGTAKDEVEGTWSRAKPDIWEKYPEFEAAANDLISSSAKLAEVAKTGSVGDFKAQFQLVERACLGCHEFKPTGGGKFRFAR